MSIIYHLLPKFCPTRHPMLIAKQHSYYCNRKYSQKLQRNKSKKSFQEMQSWRREQASRSIMIYCLEKRVQDMIHFCQNKGGKVANWFQFPTNKCFYLVEFKDIKGISSLLNETSSTPHQMRKRVPVDSRHIIFWEGYRASIGNRMLPRMEPVLPKQKGIKLEDLQNVNSLSEQMMLLHKNLSMSDFDIRTRYMIAYNLEEVIQGFLPYSGIHIFGSSASGIGRYDCDLDMMLELEAALFKTEFASKSDLQKSLSEVRMFYMSKDTTNVTDQYVARKTVGMLGDFMSVFLPQHSKVHVLRQARVPIVGSQHAPSLIECDICVQNKVGTIMTEILYTYSELDWRFKPLVFTVRSWALSNGVTYAQPGSWLSNYMLTMLLIYFLQNTSPPVLHTLQHLQSLSDNEDKVHLDKGGRSIPVFRKLHKAEPSQNHTDLGALFLEFLNFYAEMDFKKYGLSVVSGGLIDNPNQDLPIHFENPLDPSHNICQNVKEDDLNKFQTACKDTNMKLFDQDHNKTGEDWGLSLVLSSVVCRSNQTDVMPVVEDSPSLFNETNKDILESTSTSSSSPPHVCIADLFKASNQH